VTVKDRDGVFAFSDPEKVVVVVVVGGGALAAAATTAVGAELATPDPAAFVAVTVTAMVEPTSALVSAYV
jgi:fructose-specific phosphotransferase system IIC component